MSETTIPKRWKTLKVFNSYSEADDFRKSLLAEDSTGDLSVKVRRCGEGGSKFKIKTWNLPARNNKKSNKKNNKPTSKKKNSR